jgi:hypothetical protein
MFLRCILCVLASTMIFALTLTFAQSESSEANSPQVTQPEVRKRVVYREKSYYDFEDTLIRGNQVGPEGTSVFRKDRVDFKSSLNLKRSFIPELKESAK